MGRSKLWSRLLVASALTSGCTTAALAQPAGSNTPSQTQATTAGATSLEEVLVTARRTAENIQKVPVAVSAFSGEKLHTLVINNTQDLSKLSPSLQTSSCTGQRNTCFQPVIRGQGTSFATGQSSVAVYFGDVPNFAVSYVDLQDLQVLKGPQGTLFGETATGGALLFVPKKPTNSFDGYARVQVGNYAYRTFEGAIGGPIVADKLLARVAGQIRLRDGFTTDYPSHTLTPGLADPKRMDNIDSGEWRVSVVWRPVDNVEDYFLYAGNDIRNHGTGQIVYYADSNFMSPAAAKLIPANNPVTAANYQYATGGVPPPAGMTWAQLVNGSLTHQLAIGPRALFNDYSRDSESQFTGFINQLRWDITPYLTVKDITGLYWTRNRGATIDTDASDLPAIDTLAVTNPGGGYAWTGGWPARTLTNEIQVLGSLFEDKLKWQAGYYYKDTGSRAFTGPTGVIIVLAAPQALTVAGPTCNSTYGTALAANQFCTTLQRTYQWASGLYGQGTYAILPNFHFTGGVRLTQDYLRTDTTAGPAVFQTVNGIQVATRQIVDPIPGATFTSSVVPKSSHITYTLAWDWQVNRDTLVYITHRTGYKGGGINGNTPIDSPLRFFGPETIKDIEIGVKSDLDIYGVKVRNDVAIYQDWYSNIQRRSILAGSAQTVTSNLANAIIKGIEWETTVIPNEWFDVSGYFSITDGKYQNWVENSTCAAQFFRPQCYSDGVIGGPNALPGATPVTINHSAGLLVINGKTTPFPPDLFNSTSKYRFGITPSVHLKPWLSQDITITANIYYRSQFSTDDNNESNFAGHLEPMQTLFGVVSNSLVLPGYTMVDMRLDWRNVLGRPISVAAAVTNLMDIKALQGTAGGLTIAGMTPVIVSEPRMWYLEFNYQF